MFKFRLVLVFMIVAMLVTSIASAQAGLTGSGGRAANPSSGANAAKVLKQCRAHPGVSFVIQSGC